MLTLILLLCISCFESLIFSPKPELFPIKSDYVHVCKSEQIKLFDDAHYKYDTYVFDDYCTGKYRRRSLIYCNNFCAIEIDMTDVEESQRAEKYNYCVKTCTDIYNMDFPQYYVHS